MNYKEAQTPFNWIFAIIVGAVIIFLALFFATRQVNIERYKYDTATAAQLSILFNPLETSIIGSSVTLIPMPFETRMNLRCKHEGIGREELRVTTKSSVGSEWQEYSSPQSLDKYVFSRNVEEGKKLYIFSKQFKMPFDVADIIYATMGDYCFVNPPEDIAEELKDLNSSNMNVELSKNKCKTKSRTVCFGNAGCEVNVYGTCTGLDCDDEYDYGFIQQKDSKMYYKGDALMYAAIFSEQDLYNCNVKRLLSRISLISRLYIEKTRLLDARECMTGTLSVKLSELNYAALSAIPSSNILNLLDKAKEVENSNSEIVCRVF